MIERPRLFTLLAISLVLVLGSGVAALAQTSGAKIVITPFEAAGGREAEAVAKSFPESLSRQLREQGLTVVTEGKGRPGDAAAARSAAQAARASHAVTGSVNQVGGMASVDAKIINAATGAVVPVFSQAGGPTGVNRAAADIVAKLRGETAPGGKIAAVDVEGLTNMDKDFVLSKVSTAAGESADPKIINDDLKRLFDSGFFEDIEVRQETVPGGTKVVFVVKEKPRISAIGVIGAKNIDKDDILEAMTVKTGSVLNLKMLADDLNKIREIYRKKGYYTTDVSYQLEQADRQLARLNIVVKESPKLYIQEIAIQGAKKESASSIRDELSLQERGMISWLTGTGILKEEMLERDVSTIENYYANRGYMDVKVGQPDVQIKNDGIHIIFVVEEGERYRISKVSFTGDFSDDDKKFREVTKLHELAAKKAYFDRAILRDDLSKLSELMADQGYAFNDADVDIKPSSEDKTVEVTYQMTKNQKVFVRRVTIEGNDRTRENVIRRQLRLADGDQYSGTKLKRSNERLEKLDYFEKVDIETVPTGDPNTVDVKVKVKDKNTGSIGAGVGYSTSDGVYVGGQISEKNLFGQGYDAQFSGTFGARSSRFVAGFTNPNVFDTKLLAGVQGYSTYRRYRDFDKTTQGGKGRVQYPLGEFTTVQMDYKLEHYNLSHVNPYASSTISQFRGSRWLSSVYLGIARDTTDSRLKATKGYFAEIGTEYAGGLVGGNDAFIKPYWNFHYFKSLWFEHVFHFRNTMSILFANSNEQVPVVERFWLGGIQNIRGYSQDIISPRDPRTRERIGGTAEFITNFEYIFPIAKQYGLLGVAFFDAGNTWRENNEIDTFLYKSIGAGARWYSPMGLIRVEYGYGLDAGRLHNQSPHQIGFTMGSSF